MSHESIIPYAFSNVLTVMTPSQYIKTLYLPLSMELHPCRFALLAAEDTHQGNEPLKSEGDQGKNRFLLSLCTFQFKFLRF
jgi:hypothetical protein